MKRALALLIAMVLALGCTAAFAQQPQRKMDFPDNTFENMAPDYISGITQRGKTVLFTYQAKTPAGEEYTKRAIVYVPYGYDPEDEETRYNVIYLMHGGGNGYTYYFNAPGAMTPLQLMLDAIIEKGRVKPFLLVTPTYNVPGQDETYCSKNFWYELKNYLIPAFEAEYNTYAQDVTPEGIMASRTHRAYAGFSMGAVSTWAVFANCLDEIAYYMPFSGGAWQAGSAEADALYLARCVTNSGHTKDDFFIYAGCGGEGDSAYRGMTQQIEAMRELPDVFVYCENFRDGNLYYTQCDGGHSVQTVIKVMYSGLPTFFDE